MGGRKRAEAGQGGSVEARARRLHPPRWNGVKPMLRAVFVGVLVVVPGGLLVLAAWVLARALAVQARREEGTAPRRYARAMATVEWPRVWRHARASLRLRGVRGS